MNGVDIVYLTIAIITCLFSGLAATFAFFSWRSRRTSVPNFSVYFPGEKSSRIAMHDQLTKVVIEIKNIGREVAENIEVHILFPPEFDISLKDQSNLESNERYRLSKVESDSEFPNYWNVFFFIDGLGPTYWDSKEIIVKTPSKPREYGIFVDIICKGIGIQTHSLFLNVI